MKCTNCDTNIPPEWASVIAKNVCPACDQPIFNDFAVELMTELTEALEQMPTNNVQGLVSWLMSNYKMQKIGDAKPVTEFFDGKKKQSSSNNIDESNLKIAKNPLQEFIKRTGMDPNKINQYKALAEEINSGDIGEEPDISVDENDVPETENPEETMRIVQAMEGGKSLKRTKPSPKIMDDGTDELPKALQLDRLKRLQQQQNVANGIVTSVGKSTSIRRSE